MTKIQVTDGHVYEIKDHALTNENVSTHYGNATVLGIRADAKSAREAYAFIVQLGPLNGSIYLMSRGKFKVIERDRKKEK